MFNINDKLSKNSARQLSPITLAFVGDAVYTLFVREKIVFEKDLKGNDLNRKTSNTVKATAQAEYVDKIMPILTEEELDVFRRARNAKKNTRAKNASVVEYNKSTGFEAIIGFLYVTGEIERLNYLLNFGETDENIR